MTARRSGVEGWPLVGVAALVVSALVAVVFAVSGVHEAGLRAAIRATAGSSLVFFLAAFVARPMNTLASSASTKWLLRNRRYVGVSFAVSQLAHALLIGALVDAYSASFWSRVQMTTIVGGGFGYLLISGDDRRLLSTAKRRSGSGRTAWSALHTTGMYVFWVIFAASYAGRSALSVRYAVSFGLLLLAMGVRVAAARKRASKGAARAHAPRVGEPT